MKKVILKEADLLYEISGMAYVVADVRVGSKSDHELHQTFDVCQTGNVDRVRHILTLAFMEVTQMAGRLLARSSGPCKSGYRLCFNAQADAAKIEMVKGLVEEYMVARVLDDWLTVTLPEAAAVWADKWRQAAAGIRSHSLLCGAFTRRVPPL